MSIVIVVLPKLEDAKKVRKTPNTYTTAVFTENKLFLDLK